MSALLSTLSYPELGLYSLSGLLAVWACYFLVGYFGAHAALRKFPGPPAAAWTQLWLAKQSRNGVRSLSVHEQHMKHGKFVRIGPNEGESRGDEGRATVGVTRRARVDHRTPCESSFDCGPRRLADRIRLLRLAQIKVSLPSTPTPRLSRLTPPSPPRSFYDAFVSLYRGLFNTRDRAEHTRKRKIISHTFSPKAVREFEPYIAATVRVLLGKWDALAERAAGEEGGELKGWAVIELLDCEWSSLQIG